MKFFTNKKLWQKILIVTLGIIMLSFICAKPVHADWLSGVAGKLFEPILQFLVGLGDTLIDFLQDQVLGLGQAFLEVDRGGNFWAVVIGVIVAAVVVAFILITGGAGSLVGLALLKLAVTAVAKGLVIGRNSSCSYRCDVAR